MLRPRPLSVAPVPASVFALWTLALSGCAPKPVELTELAQESTRAPLYVASSRLWPGATVPVCWERAAYDDPAIATERGWVRTAVEETWERVAAIRFTGWGPCAAGSAGIRIRTRDSGPYTLGLGTEIDGVKEGMALNFAFSTWSPGCQRTRAYCIRVGAVHEFGHAIGFAHEQNRADTPSWCTDEQGADGDLVVGAWDLDSVMNYCNPRWTGDGKLSPTDEEGTAAAYGTGGGWDVARAETNAFAAPSRTHDSTGRGAETSILADVTGDGRADAVVIFATPGEWWVAPAHATGGFGPLQRWGRDLAARADRYLLADVTGDGKSDAVAFFGTGSWWVAPSSGSAFGTAALWKSGHGAGSSAQLLADVTGDGKSDAVAFFSATGNWWVAPSSGSAFSSYSSWKSGHGAGSSAQLLADVTGDGRADAVAFFSATGNWWVAPSSGSAFSSYSSWKSGHGAGSSAQLVADVTGDGKADAIAVFAERGAWWVAPSSGSAFGLYALWRGGLGTALLPDLTRALTGDTDGDGKADAVVRWLR